jgi:hypothetical protein
VNRLRFNFATAGILLAVVALWRDDKRITWVAIGVLAIAVILRIVSRRWPPAPPES